jgi:hypothetical protein
MTTNETLGPSGTLPDRYLEDISADELSANAPADETDANRDARRERNRKRNERRRRLRESLPIRNLMEALDQVKNQVHTTPEQCLMSITMIARQAQGMRAGEVIAKLVVDAYFMRLDNRVTQVPPVRNRQQDNEATSRNGVDNGRNRTRGELRANPNRTWASACGPSHGGNSAGGADGNRDIIPHRDPSGGGSDGGSSNHGAGRRDRAEVTAAAEATRTAAPPALHVAASTLAKKSKNYDAKSPHGRRQRRLPRFLCTASQSTSPIEIQTSGDHQVRCEARSSTVSHMLRPLHRKRWWQ